MRILNFNCSIKHARCRIFWQISIIRRHPFCRTIFFRCLVKITVTKSQQTFHRIFTFCIQACQWGNTKAAVSDTFKNMVEKMFNGAATAKGASVVPILQSICGWAGIFYREDNEKTMTQCQRCDHHN